MWVNCSAYAILKLMKRQARHGGYTIVEVMIFLVITGALLASALLVFNGRQRRTQFTQGVREIESQIRTLINETASGYYPNQGNIKCTSSGGGGPNLSASSENQQGGNEGCLFLGRVLQFTTGESYYAYTVVGQQKGASGKEVTSLGTGQDEARQTLITPTDSQPTLPDATDEYRLPWGITVSKIATPIVATPTIGSLGFISSFGTYNDTGTDLVSGTTSLNLIPLLGSALTNDKATLLTEVNNMGDDPQNPGRIVICLSSGEGDRRAAIIIGGSNNNIGTEVLIDNVPGECEDA